MDLTAAGIDVRRGGLDFRAMFEVSPVPVAVLDGAGCVLVANPALALLLGRTPADLAGTTLHELTVGDDLAEIEAAGRFGLGVAEWRLRHAEGHEVQATVTGVELPGAGTNALLLCFDDATSRRDTERFLLHAALHDSLTNLPNRRLLRDRLDTALARSARNSSTVAVLFIDLDRFKDVNDTYGHDVGDEVLVGVAAGIHAALRTCDTVARLGGDEFVVVCEDVTAEDDVERLAERLLAGIETPVTIGDRSVSVTASIGVAVAGAEVESGQQLLRLADLAMYRAKHRPGTSYVMADESIASQMDRDAAEAGGLLADLRHAIQADLLQLHYQPVVQADGTLVGLEALVRWRHPRLGLLLPDDFLPWVAGTDLARPLSDWVLRAAVSDAASWGDVRLRVSINMWASEVARPGFAETVEMLLEWAELPARGLYLELHEADLPAAGRGLTDEVDRLRGLGVGLVFDDYGRGGRSPTGRIRLPVAALKVDRRYVAGCLTDPADSAVVAAVAAAALAGGRLALASGVENVEQLRLLAGLGYQCFQGFLCGAPAALDDLRDVIADGRVSLGDS